MADDRQKPSERSGFAVRLHTRPKGLVTDTPKATPPEAELEKLVGPTRDVQARVLSSTDAANTRLAKLAEQPAEQQAIRARLSDRISEPQKIAAPFREMHERTQHLTDAVSGSSGLAKLASQITDQQKAIDMLRAPNLSRMDMPCLPEPRAFQNVPQNPTYETNERLERIEARFEQIEKIAVESANVANGLQGAAVEFLVKFEHAAKDNDHAAGRAISIAKLAVVIAVVGSLAQIIYTEFWRVPHDTAVLQAALLEMKTEIADLRMEQANVAERLAAAIMDTDRDNTQILREIRDLLGSMQLPAAPDAAPD